MDMSLAYEILSQRKMHEANLVWHRMSGLLITNSLLLVTFFISIQYDRFSMLHVALPIIAILISAGFATFFRLRSNSSLVGTGISCPLGVF
jgi:hypothetical protein